MSKGRNCVVGVCYLQNLGFARRRVVDAESGQEVQVPGQLQHAPVARLGDEAGQLLSAGAGLERVGRVPERGREDVHGLGPEPFLARHGATCRRRPRRCLGLALGEHLRKKKNKKVLTLTREPLFKSLQVAGSNLPSTSV